jgi:hypothetical protein
MSVNFVPEIRAAKSIHRNPCLDDPDLTVRHRYQLVAD